MSAVLGFTHCDGIRYYTTSNDRKVVKTVEVNDYILIDYNAEGKISGLESWHDSALEEFLGQFGFVKEDLNTNVEDYINSQV